MDSLEIKKIVKKEYAKIAKQSSCCCKSKSDEEISQSIGYSLDDIMSVPDANLGLGCGNPVALSNLKVGDIVLDLGSGAGFDAFLAARIVKDSGHVIGVDMTPEMIERAKNNAKKYNYNNVEFKLGEIENLPIDDDSIDVVISNCVINLSPNKSKVFSEAFRVLKKGGRMFVSDIVLLGELTEAQLNDEKLMTGCVSGALQIDDYLEKIKSAGFSVKILNEDKEISKRQYEGIPLESLKVECIKK